MIILDSVSRSTDFKSSVRNDAENLSNNLCKFETILLSFTFMRIFAITTPVSDYLQTAGLDVMQAWRMVSNAIEQINNISRDFKSIYMAAKKKLIM